MLLYESQYYGVQSLDMDVDSLSHHGILGMKWGVRRYQNKDGTLTPAGMKRYHTNRAGKPGHATLTRHTAKMYEKYNLLEPNPSKDQAWDNAFDMVSKGASKREVERYLEDAGINRLTVKRAYKDISKTKDSRITRKQWEENPIQNVVGSQEEFDKNVKLWSEADYDSLPKKEADAVVDYQSKITASVYDWYNDESNHPRINECIQKKTKLPRQSIR